MTDDTAPAATSGVKFPPPAIYLLCLAGGFLLGWLRPAAVWPAHALEVRTVGILLFVVGLATGFWAIVTFRATRTSPNPMRPTAALAFAGPYRFSRNPMYLGLASGERGSRALLQRPLAPAVGSGRVGVRGAFRHRPRGAIPDREVRGGIPALHRRGAPVDLR